MAVSMNILMISPDAPPHKGGISRLVNLLKQGLEWSGHNVSLICPRFRVRELKFSAIPFHEYSDRYDLIHLHGPTPFLSDLTLITNAKSRIVYTHHAEVCWISESLSAAYRHLHRFLAKKAQKIIVHSYDYSRLFKRSKVIMLRLPSPIEPPKNKIELDQKSDSFTVLYVGQFRPFKGVDMLINAAKTLQKVKFVLVGEGYLKPKFMNMAKNLKNVNFVDATNDDELRQLYCMSHVICLPSVNTTEAYGLVLLEGALYGCVPLASDLMGVAENVSLLKGLSFEKKSLESLTRNIEMLANNKDLWTNIALQSHKAAYNYALTYTPELYVKKHEEIFRKVCESD
jgi:rhamnosyl/mannosyltransferase